MKPGDLFLLSALTVDEAEWHFRIAA